MTSQLQQKRHRWARRKEGSAIQFRYLHRFFMFHRHIFLIEIFPQYSVLGLQTFNRQNYLRVWFFTKNYKHNFASRNKQQQQKRRAVILSSGRIHCYISLETFSKITKTLQWKTTPPPSWTITGAETWKQICDKPLTKLHHGNQFNFTPNFIHNFCWRRKNKKNKTGKKEK